MKKMLIENLNYFPVGLEKENSFKTVQLDTSRKKIYVRRIPYSYDTRRQQPAAGRTLLSLLHLLRKMEECTQNKKVFFL